MTTDATRGLHDLMDATAAAEERRELLVREREAKEAELDTAQRAVRRYEAAVGRGETAPDSVTEQAQEAAVSEAEAALARLGPRLAGADDAIRECQNAEGRFKRANVQGLALDCARESVDARDALVEALAQLKAAARRWEAARSAWTEIEVALGYGTPGSPAPNPAWHQAPGLAVDLNQFIRGRLDPPPSPLPKAIEAELAEDPSRQAFQVIADRQEELPPVSEPRKPTRAS